MQSPQGHPHEAERLALLARLRVLDTAAEPEFDDIVDLAAAIAGTPIALVSLVDRDRQWFKAHHGLAASETPRDVAFCAHAILDERSPLVVPDARTDQRFCDNPLVEGPPRVVFYAGFPLRVGFDRLPLGTLCVIDNQPRALAPETLRQLGVLARHVEALLELRLRNDALNRELEAIQALRRSEDQVRRLALVAERTINGVIITDPAGRTTWVNAGFTALTGYTLEEMRDRRPGAVLQGRDTDPLTVARLRAAFVAGEACETEMLNYTKAGETRWLRLAIQPLFAERAGADGGRRIESWMALTTDLTAARRTTEQLREAVEIAESAMRAKGEFLATMSHEIRTPMNGVIGMTNLLADTNLDDTQREHVETIRSCGESLLTLINDVLDLSKMEVGRLELEAVPFSLTEIVHDALQLLSGQAEQRGIALHYQLPEALPAWVIGDPNRLRQVLLNLMGNALKFTERGSVSLDLAVLGQDDRQLRFSIAVRDTGIGMSPEQLARIGEPFSQADTSTTRRFGGSGLGLSICKRLITLMHGSIEVESTEGLGSTFRFTVQLPLSQRAPASAGRIAGRRVLCLDDQPLSLRLMDELCRSWDLQTETFANVLDLMARLRRADPLPDLVLTDHEMPGIDGVALSRLVRSDPRLAGLPVLVASSDADRARRELGTLPLTRVISKPLRPSRLLEALHRMLRPEAEPLIGAPSIRLGRVLVAEDNRVNQRLIQLLLRDRCARVDVVDTGTKAVAATAADDYDCVLMDCQMPELDGYAATRAIREREQRRPGRHLVIIALTANALAGDRERCLAAGMDDYLSKPLRVEDLDAVLHRHFPGAEPAAEPPVGVSAALRAAVDALRRNLGEDGFQQIAAAVRDEFPQLLADLRQALRQRDRPRLAKLAHSLKGSAANLELEALCAACLALEQAAKADQSIGLESLVGAIGSLTEQAIAAFSPAASRGE